MSATHEPRSPVPAVLICCLIAAASLLVSLPASAAGPFLYSGVDPSAPPDSMGWDYPDVGPGQTQVVTAYVYTGDAMTDGGHFGIGLRGPSVDFDLPLGRGLAFGTLINTPDAFCVGVAVENFSVNRADGAGIVDGTCRPFTFKSDTTYEFVVRATDDDVTYTISERIYDPEVGRFEYLQQLSGSCRALAQASPTQDDDDCGQRNDVLLGEEDLVDMGLGPEDLDAGDFFIGTAFVPTGLSWSSQLFVEHF